jgi:hypothetical protein
MKSADNMFDKHRDRPSSERDFFSLRKFQIASINVVMPLAPILQPLALYSFCSTVVFSLVFQPFTMAH